MSKSLNDIATIRTLWLGYAADNLPADAVPEQERQVRRAFYGGAWAMFCLFEALGNQSLSDDQGFAILDRLRAECEAFAELTRTGRA